MKVIRLKFFECHVGCSITDDLTINLYLVLLATIMHIVIYRQKGYGQIYARRKALGRLNRK